MAFVFACIGAVFGLSAGLVLSMPLLRVAIEKGPRLRAELRAFIDECDLRMRVNGPKTAHNCGNDWCSKEGQLTCALCDDCGPPPESHEGRCPACGLERR